MAITLPDVGASNGTWGTILNATLTQLNASITTNAADIDAVEANVATLQSGASKVSTVGSRPTAASAGLGAIHLDPATGFLTYVASIGGALTWVPWPGSLMASLKQATTAQSIPNNTVTNITMQTADQDRLNGWNSGANPSRYTVAVAGWYQIAGSIAYAPNATGARNASYSKNGTTIAGSINTAAASATPAANIVHPRTMPAYLVAGDYVELAAYQNSGGALNTITSYGCVLNLTYMGAA